MTRDELDRGWGETPACFTERIDDTLLLLKEEPPVKKISLRVAVLALLIVLALCGAAYAIVLSQGQEWYYNNRFTAHQVNEPEKQSAILSHLQTDVPQQSIADAAGLVTMTVQDYAWVEEQQLFTLSMAARPTDGNAYELHPLWNLDADGWEDGRTEHWLWTDKGFGLPKDVMLDPGKRLLLVDAMANRSVTVGDTDCAMPAFAMDGFDSAEGGVVFVTEFDMTRLDEDALRARFPAATATGGTSSYTTLRPLDDADADPSADTSAAVTRLQNRLCDLGFLSGEADGRYDERTRLAVEAFQRANGLAANGIAGVRTQEALFSDGAISVEGNSDTAQRLAPAGENPVLTYALEEAAATREAIARSTDENGMLTLCLHYTVTPLENGELGEAAAGKVYFQVKIK